MSPNPCPGQAGAPLPSQAGPPSSASRSEFHGYSVPGTPPLIQWSAFLPAWQPASFRAANGKRLWSYLLGNGMVLWDQLRTPRLSWR
jgi:hypothetical protein